MARVSCSAFVNSLLPVANLFTISMKSSAMSIFQEFSFFIIFIPESLYLSWRSDRSFFRRIGLTSVTAINSWSDMKRPERKSAASIFLALLSSISESSSSRFFSVRWSGMRLVSKLRFLAFMKALLSKCPR